MKKIIMTTIVSIMSIVGVSHADVETKKNNDGTFDIIITESVELEDVDKVKDALNHPKFSGWVGLDNRGGYVAAGWEIAYEIRKAEAKTYVNEGARCMSACTYIFMGGVERYLEGEAKLSYHPAWADSYPSEYTLNDVYKVGQQDALETAQAFSYYVEKGAEWHVLSFLTHAYGESSKDTFYHAGAEELGKAGIVTHTF